MKFTTLLTVVAASALMSGAAFAQATDQAPGPVNPAPGAAPAPAAEPTPPTEPSAATSPAPTPPAADTGSATSTSVTASDPATGTSVTTTTTTNGPVPDTAENRAKYGGPMSHAGKRSAPKGN